MDTFGNRKEKRDRKKKNHNDKKKIKDKIIRDIRTPFEQAEEEDCCKPERVSNFWDNN